MYSGTVSPEQLVTKPTKFKGELLNRFEKDRASFLSYGNFLYTHPAAPPFPCTLEEFDELVFSIEALNIPDEYVRVVHGQTPYNDLKASYCIPIKYNDRYVEFNFAFFNKPQAHLQNATVNYGVLVLDQPTPNKAPYFEVQKE
jgi:hypothetical protein